MGALAGKPQQGSVTHELEQAVIKASRGDATLGAVRERALRIMVAEVQASVKTKITEARQIRDDAKRRAAVAEQAAMSAAAKATAAKAKMEAALRLSETERVKAVKARLAAAEDRAQEAEESAAAAQAKATAEAAPPPARLVALVALDWRC